MYNVVNTKHLNSMKVNKDVNTFLKFLETSS